MTQTLSPSGVCQGVGAIAEWYGCSIFSVLRNTHNSHSSWANLHSHQQYIMFLFPSTCIHLHLYLYLRFDNDDARLHSIRRCVELVLSFYLYMGPEDQTLAISLVQLVFHQRPLPSEPSAQCVLFMKDLLTGVRQDFNVIWI